MLVDYHHAPEVPVDLYVAHIHKSTGTYVAYPGAAFVGDQLFPEVHAQQLENTLFWPAITENEVSRTSIAVVTRIRFRLPIRSLCSPEVNCWRKLKHDELLPFG
jgi:hypothetical protein